MSSAAVAHPPEERAPREEATFTKRESVSPDNRRIHPRYAVDLDITLSSEHNFYQGFAENISTGGLFIATHQLRPAGEKFEITLNLPGHPEIKAIGEVRWVREYSERSDVPPGMGIRFVSLPDWAAPAITQFLKDREPLFYDDD